MKELIARRLDGSEPVTDFSLLEFNPIDSDNWNFRCHITASFGIGHDAQNIYLRYIVKESNIRARYEHMNDSVHEDSCVEFFISFGNDSYYNLEFNCIGTIHGAYGRNREDRIRLKEKLIETIQITPSLGTSKILILDRETEWSLDVIIPIAVFEFTNLSTFQHVTANCNFYKCGDKQVVPHYLSWNPIESENPDFHRPEYFGEIKFA